jgi:hypothetical protein
MRATHASIGQRLKSDPKVTADQRDHGVAVAIDEYTKTSVKDKGPWLPRSWSKQF